VLDSDHHCTTLTEWHICAQITELENRLHHTSMSASEEKRVVDEIGKLRRSKKAAAGVASANANTEKRAEDLRAELKEYDNELNSIKEEQVSMWTSFA
jgi:uncharacterized coiled-coil DUF342 family protein